MFRVCRMCRIVGYISNFQNWVKKFRKCVSLRAKNKYEVHIEVCVWLNESTEWRIKVPGLTRCQSRNNSLCNFDLQEVTPSLLEILSHPGSRDWSAASWLCQFKGNKQNISVLDSKNTSSCLPLWDGRDLSCWRGGGPGQAERGHSSPGSHWRSTLTSGLR